MSDRIILGFDGAEDDAPLVGVVVKHTEPSLFVSMGPDGSEEWKRIGWTKIGWIAQDNA
jgi:hypothetical protein